MKLTRLCVLVCVLLVVGVPVYVWLINPYIWEAGIRREAIEGLSRARTEGEREAAVRAGVTVTYPDGSWIAIYYADTHAMRVQSLAILHDSLGRWYESEEHYCALFGTVRHQGRKAIGADLEPEELALQSTGFEGRAGRLYELIWSGDPHRATPHIEAIGFREFMPEL